MLSDFQKAHLRSLSLKTLKSDVPSEKVSIERHKNIQT